MEAPSVLTKDVFPSEKTSLSIKRTSGFESKQAEASQRYVTQIIAQTLPNNAAQGGDTVT